MLAPALLRSLLDDQQTFGEYTGSSVAKRQPRRAEGLVGCTCSCRSQSAFLNRESLQHPINWNQVCPMHGQYERTALLFKCWTLCNHFLSYTIQVSLNITKGAGGFSISPHLEFHAIVPISSPVFSLLSNAEDGLRSETVGITLENTQTKLFALL